MRAASEAPKTRSDAKGIMPLLCPKATEISHTLVLPLRCCSVHQNMTSSNGASLSIEPLLGSRWARACERVANRSICCGDIPEPMSCRFRVLSAPDSCGPGTLQRYGCCKESPVDNRWQKVARESSARTDVEAQTIKGRRIPFPYGQDSFPATALCGRGLSERISSEASNSHRVPQPAVVCCS